MSGALFGTEVVSALLYRELSALPAVTAAVGTRIHGLMVAPTTYRVPFLLFHPEQSSYPTEPIGSGEISSETMRFAVRLICGGESTGPIRAAAIAQLDHFLTAGPIDYVWEDLPFQVTFTPLGEYPLTTLLDGADISRQLGTLYSVECLRGGA